MTTTPNNCFTVLIDLDSTVYDLCSPTLNYLNTKHSTTYKPKDITTWGWYEDVGLNPYEFWDKEGTFANLKPYAGAVQAINLVHDAGIRQVFFSTLVSRHGAWDKFEAIDRDFPFIGRENTLLTGGFKDLAYGDVLVDDGPHNLEAFHGPRKYTVLVNMHNSEYCKSDIADYVLTNWADYPSLMQALKRSKQLHVR